MSAHIGAVGDLFSTTLIVTLWTVNAKLSLAVNVMLYMPMSAKAGVPENEYKVPLFVFVKNDGTLVTLNVRDWLGSASVKIAAQSCEKLVVMFSNTFMALTGA